MKLSIIFFSFACVASSVYADIPKQFHGNWVEQGECETFKKYGVANPAITATNVNAMENYCTLKKPIQESATTFSGNFSCSIEGEKSMQKITLKITDGKLLWNDSPPRSKCK